MAYELITSTLAQIETYLENGGDIAALRPKK
jgi:hypothetical protein